MRAAAAPCPRRGAPGLWRAGPAAMAVAALCAERAGPGRARGAQPPDRGRGGAGAAAGAEHPRSPAVRELQSPRRPLDRHAGAWGPGRAPRSAPRQPPFCRRPERVVPRVLAPRRAGTRSGAADVTGLRPAPSVVRVGQKEALDAGYWLLRVLWYSNSEGQNPIMNPLCTIISLQQTSHARKSYEVACLFPEHLPDGQNRESPKGSFIHGVPVNHLCPATLAWTVQFSSPTAQTLILTGHMPDSRKEKID
ncbi:uncharacterized protein LOC121075289 isoform X2 [Cygnus olor]|uniref:uncharacterized protein LOC121075289 isoform X2 n=1 Tax=Cygnus olor TaxID=8869 RepID=UPI001ADE36E7|nr:uncharacterized protein LOC121075289 isoform X2 [Cygnus olor]